MFSVYVFTPQSATPVYEKKCITENTISILGAAFVPHLQEKQNPSFGQWQRKSQLFFLDTNQVLLLISSCKTIYISYIVFKIYMLVLYSA